MRFCEVTGQVFDFQLLAGGLFQVGDDALAELDVVARVLAVSEGIGQGAGRIANSHRDAAGGLDLGDRVIGLGHGAAGGEGHHGKSDQMLLHTDSLR
jgi:hypothetical protein